MSKKKSEYRNEKIKNEVLKEDESTLQEKHDKLLLEYSIKKYEDEMRREDNITNQCNFYMGIITVLIAAAISIFGFIEFNFKDMLLSIIFVGIIVIFLICSLALIIVANYFLKKDYLSKVSDLEDKLSDNETEWKGIISQSFNQTVESFSKVNSRRIRIIMIASYLLLITLALSIIFAVIIFIRSI